MQKNDVILITGASGMLGHHVYKCLVSAGFTRILCPPRLELDLLDLHSVETYIADKKPDYIFHLAALVYGLGGNLSFQINALYNNSLINLNLVKALCGSNVKKVFFAGTVASYPFPFHKLPLTEDQLFFGVPHSGEYGYATAKLLGYHACELLKQESNIDYCVGLFTNLFGEHDTFDVKYGHVIPSLMAKMHYAKVHESACTVWGAGNASRDFLYAEDAARAAVFMMNHGEGVVNIASGKTHTMKELVDCLSMTLSFSGDIIWDTDAPVGIVERSVDITRMRTLGFEDPMMDLPSALSKTYKWYTDGLVLKE